MLLSLVSWWQVSRMLGKCRLSFTYQQSGPVIGAHLLGKNTQQCPTGLWRELSGVQERTESCLGTLLVLKGPLPAGIGLLSREDFLPVTRFSCLSLGAQELVRMDR